MNTRCPIFIFLLVLSLQPFASMCQNRVTNYSSLQQQIRSLDSLTPQLSTRLIGQSAQGRDLTVMLFSDGVFGSDRHKLKVLIFAQQHGNEQSGKEGVLRAAKWLADSANVQILKSLDIALVPQLNPDGSEVNQRRNGRQADLNRNHLVLTEPETQAIHRLFDEFGFHLTLDVHEYYPYGEEWKKTGYRRNTDVALGSCTHPDVDLALREFSNQKVLPFLMDRLRQFGFKSFVYCPGGPSGEDYFRHSTFDINDGRQSFGIQQTLSFIQEGMNGEDLFEENMEFRAQGQFRGIQSLLLFACQNADEILQAVTQARQKMLEPASGRKLTLQAEHQHNNQELHLPLFSYRTGHDTLVVVNDYRPVVKATAITNLPEGYLIPVENKALLDWAERQQLLHTPLPQDAAAWCEQYFVAKVDSIDFEGDMVIDPQIETYKVKQKIEGDDYVFFPVSQPKGLLMAIGIEPQSMLGLATYESYRDLVEVGQFYPILRFVKPSPKKP